MSNYSDEVDKLRSHYEELERKHRALDKELEERYNNTNATDEARRMKTMKLYLKDEMHRINSQLVQLGLK
jgi:hypothetical protein